MDKIKDKGEFRRTLAQFPTGVTVVTTVSEDCPVGMTVSSFNSVSQEPPLVLWSIDKSALSITVFSAAEYFTVNVLSKSQSDIANHFSRKGADKFAGVKYREGKNGCPVLADIAAHFECRVWSVYEGGDHLIIVGEVLDYSCHDQTTPLVFSQSSYAMPVQQAFATSGQADTSTDSFLEEHLLYLLWCTHSLYSSDLYQLLLGECKVAPEEWRILTLLLDRRQLSADEIARMVSQPPDDCRHTLDRLQADGYLSIGDNDLVKIKSAGVELAKNLALTAARHEQKITTGLEKDQPARLKQSLRTILQTLGQA